MSPSAPIHGSRANDLKPVIVLTGHVVAIGVIRSLGMMGVPIINIYFENRSFSYSSRYVQEKIRTPHPKNHEREFIDHIIDCAQRYGQCLVIPGDDFTLCMISRHKTELEQYHVVASPDWSVTEKFIDKPFTYDLAQSIGVAAPKTCYPESIEDLAKVADEMMFPCLVKPCQGHEYFELFGKKMKKVQDLHELTVAYKQATEAGLEVMVQEFVPGDDTQGLSYCSYRFPDGNYVDFTARKIRLGPTSFGVPRVALSESAPEIIDPSRKILEALKFFGYSCTEYKFDQRDGVYKLMEINGRFNRSIRHSVKCGINFPWIAYQNLMYQNVVDAQQDEVPTYWIDFPNDLMYSLRCLPMERYWCQGYVRPYINRKTFAILDWKDIRPVFSRMAGMLKPRTSNDSADE